LADIQFFLSEADKICQPGNQPTSQPANQPKAGKRLVKGSQVLFPWEGVVNLPGSRHAY